MAKGRAVGRFEAFLGLIGVTALVVTYAVITGWNPLPGIANWARQVSIRTLSEPKTAWTVRAGDAPSAATVLPSAIIVMGEGSVEARSPVTGARLWSHDDSWAAVAGDAEPVVIVGRAVGIGFDVYDATSGLRMWGSPEKAGIWPYADMILVLTCPQEFSCTMRAVDPLTGKKRWDLPITGAGRTLIGLDEPLAALGTVSSQYAATFAAIPHPAPSIIGLPMGGDIHVIKTDGRALQIYHPDSSTRIVVTRHTVVESTATMRGSTCYYGMRVTDPSSGKTTWNAPGYNLRTSTGLGCDQRHDPVGGGDVVLAIDTSGRDVLLNTLSRRVLYRAKSGEHVIATDGQIAIVRTADRKSVRTINLASGGQLWTREAGGSALIGIAPDCVLIADPGVGRLAAVGRTSGRSILDVATGATVLGLGGSTLVINIGRSFGPLPIGTSP